MCLFLSVLDTWWGVCVGWGAYQDCTPFSPTQKINVEGKLSLILLPLSALPKDGEDED